MAKTTSTSRTLIYTALYVGLCLAAPDLPVGAIKLVATCIGQFVFEVAKGAASNVVQDLPKKLWENINPFDGKFNE